MTMAGMTTKTSTVDNIGNGKFQLKNWMGSLPAKVRDLPLSMIAIPGTHDSATYQLQTTMVIAPDFDIIKKANKQPYKTMASAAISAIAPVPQVIKAWGKCLKQNTYDQLMLGIRYFDFRPMAHIGRYMHETSTWNAHSLYADRTSHEFGQIKNFLAQNPSEIVILEMNGGWYEMSDAHYAFIEAEIRSYFGSMLCKGARGSAPGSYNELRLVQNCNVIVRYKVPKEKLSKVPDFAIGGNDLQSH